MKEKIKDLCIRLSIIFGASGIFIGIVQGIMYWNLRGIEVLTKHFTEAVLVPFIFILLSALFIFLCHVLEDNDKKGK